MGITVVATGVRTGVRACRFTVQTRRMRGGRWPTRAAVKRAARRTCEHTLRLGSGARQPPLRTPTGTTAGAHVWAARGGAATTGGGACADVEGGQSSGRTCGSIVAQWPSSCWSAGAIWAARGAQWASLCERSQRGGAASCPLLWGEGGPLLRRTGIAPPCTSHGRSGGGDGAAGSTSCHTPSAVGRKSR